MSMYLAIGDKFSFDGTTLEVEEAKMCCGGCYCHGKDELCSQLKCTVGAREDRKDVVFKEVTP